MIDICPRILANSTDGIEGLILGCIRSISGEISEGALIQLEDRITEEINSIYDSDDADLPKCVS